MVHQHALLKKSINILKLLEKIPTYMYRNVNQNLTWKVEPLISSAIELSGHSIMFTIYNTLSDADPNNNKENQLGLKWWYQNPIGLQTENMHK